MDVSEIKNRLRKEYLEKRRAIPSNERNLIDSAVCRALAETDIFQKTQTVLVYAPKEPEVDILPLVDAALAMGKQVAFPRCEKNFMLSFRYAMPDQLIRGHFGIQEPPEHLPPCHAERDSICLIPALLFDEDGFRLGYGKGYYDRFLASYHGKTIGIARSAFMLPRLPRDFYDRSVDVLADETGVRFLV